MPDLNDFYAFKNTGGGSGTGEPGPGRGGCLLWILAALALLCVIGRAIG